MAAAQKGDSGVVSQTIETMFLRGEQLLVRLELLRRCVGQVCGEGLTCGEVGCVEIEVDPSTLDPFDENGALQPPDSTRPVTPVAGSGGSTNNPLPGPDPGCGNGSIDAGETCDGSNLGGWTCENLGFEGGTVTCDNCRLDDGGCYRCGDGVANGVAGDLEQCDLTDLKLETCSSLGYAGGTLSCAPGCTFNTEACCGDGVIGGNEECDGSDLGGIGDCTDAAVGGGFSGGTISCGANCRLNTTQCYRCGDGSINAGEECDGSALGGNDCTSSEVGGFDSGTLGCTTQCQYDTSGCVNFSCGDNVITGNEDCEPNPLDLNGETCSSLGFAGGTLQCAGNCSYDTSNCCGDGTRGSSEQCDGSNLDGKNCLSADFAGLQHHGGTLGCNASTCMFDLSGCLTCYDGVDNSPLETDVDCGGPCGPCADGKKCVINNDCQSGYCEPSTLTCGAAPDCRDNVINQPWEECDGTDLGGATCPAFGSIDCYPPGHPAECQLNTSGCYSCNDSQMNGNETDVDCGGSQCKRCDVGDSCVLDSDCKVGQFCNGSNVCAWPPEDCLDGIDNDGDGDPDCADSDCNSGFQCVPTVPSNWEGYYDINVQGTGGGTPPTQLCSSGGSPTRRWASPNHDPQCSACGCGNLTGATCAQPTLTCWSNHDCTGAMYDDTQYVPDDGSCSGRSFNGLDMGDSCMITAQPLETQGACSTSGGAVTAPMWGDAVDVCNTPTGGTGGCSAGFVCAARPAVNYDAVCIRRSGNFSCPAAWGTKTLSYSSGADNRSCSTCSCTPPSNPCEEPDAIDGEYTLHDTNNCSGTNVSIVPNVCQQAFPADASTYSFTLDRLPTPGGSCTANGGQASGAIATSGAYTYCCM